MFIYTKEFIRRIRAADGLVIICGSSIRAGYLIERYSLRPYIDFIFDNYSSSDEFHAIPVIKYKELSKLSDINVFICGNHCKEFYDQIRFLSCNVVFVEFIPRSAVDFFPFGFSFHIEVPDYQANYGRESCHVVVPHVLSRLLDYNLTIQTIPTRHSNEYYFKERSAQNDVLLFCFHGYGAKDYRRIYYKEGYFYDLITIDEMGYSGWSSLCHDPDELEAINAVNYKTANRDFIKYRKKYIDNNLSKYKQPVVDTIQLPSKFIFIPLQVLDDSVMHLAYFNPLVWLRSIVKVLTENNVSIVIKRHPRCHSDEMANELELLGKQKNVTIFAGSIHRALRDCAAVYTINSGVGFEALFYLKPVFTFGAVDYQSATFNIKNIGDIGDNFFPELSDEKQLYIKKFISFYMRSKSININSRSNINRFVDAVVLRYLNHHLERVLR